MDRGFPLGGPRFFFAVGAAMTRRVSRWAWRASRSWMWGHTQPQPITRLFAGFGRRGAIGRTCIAATTRMRRACTRRRAGRSRPGRREPRLTGGRSSRRAGRGDGLRRRACVCGRNLPIYFRAVCLLPWREPRSRRGRVGRGVIEGSWSGLGDQDEVGPPERSLTSRRSLENSVDRRCRGCIFSPDALRKYVRHFYSGQAGRPDECRRRLRARWSGPCERASAGRRQACGAGQSRVAEFWWWRSGERGSLGEGTGVDRAHLV